MRESFLLLASFIVWTSAVQADEEKLRLLKVGAETYTGVTVTSVTSTDIYFSHSKGLGSAKLRDLEPAMQAHFHYDPTKAAASEALQAQANALYRQSVLSAPPPKRQVASVTPSALSKDLNDGIPPHEIHAKSFLGQPAPDLIVEQWLTEQPDTSGKFVLVDIWATWCPACREAIPELNELQAKFKDRLVVIGISSETEAVIRRMTNPKIDYSVGIDSQRRTSHALEVKAIPHAILIDPRGIVRFEGMPHYLDGRNLEKLLAKYSR